MSSGAFQGFASSEGKEQVNHRISVPEQLFKSLLGSTLRNYTQTSVVPFVHRSVGSNLGKRNSASLRLLVFFNSESTLFSQFQVDSYLV
ncbi:hypothetical protein VTK73DRAFT_6714 [Phialemonium thermophilum]|uniref:Uncharacterized protein n=1 Tax=Phialemonium thermophilum TaxID=223376 RepID=A0ABR3XV66_9PEZI